MGWYHRKLQLNETHYTCLKCGTVYKFPAPPQDHILPACDVCGNLYYGIKYDVKEKVVTEISQLPKV